MTPEKVSAAACEATGRLRLTDVTRRRGRGPLAARARGRSVAVTPLAVRATPRGVAQEAGAVSAARHSHPGSVSERSPGKGGNSSSVTRLHL